MADDGRLPGVKVGRQWRFPADRVAAQLGLSGSLAAPPNGSGPPAAAAPSAAVRLGALLEPDTAQSVADLVGDLFGLMTVLIEMDGTPLTEVVNPCGYYLAIGNEPATVAACIAGWRDLAEGPYVAPHFVPAHLGFLCTRAFVWVDRRPVGLIVVGGVTPRVWPPPAGVLDGIAAELGVPVDALAAHVHETWDVPAEQQRRILQLLPQVADLVSQLAAARGELLTRLDAMSALADPSWSPNALHRREAS
jgi:Sensory domain found in PocR